MNAVELGVLDAIREHYRQLAMSGYGNTLSYHRLGHHLDVDPIRVKWAVYRLLEIGLVAVTKRANGRTNAYAMTLPRRLAASLSAAAVDDLPPF